MTIRILAFLAKGLALTLAFAFVLSFLGLGSGVVAYVALALSDIVAPLAQ